MWKASLALLLRSHLESMVSFCRLKVVPAEWRIQEMGTFLRVFYFTATCFGTATRFVSSVVHKPLDTELIHVLLALALLFPMMRSKSTVRTIEAMELLWWCNIAVCVNLYALPYSAQLGVAALVIPFVLAALIGMRFWHWLAFVACVVVMNMAQLWYTVVFQGAPQNVLSYAHTFVSVLPGLSFTMLQNRLYWKIYAAQSTLSLEKEVLGSLASLTCDATCWLKDESGIVASCDSRVHTIFRVNIMSKALTDFVATAEDASRLLDALAKSSGSERDRTPVTLLPISILRDGVSMTLELFIIRHQDRIVVDESPLGDRLIFVGMRIGKEGNAANKHPSAESEDLFDAVSGINDGDSRAEEKFHEAADGGGSARSHSVLSSLPQTTMTGKMFNSAVRQVSIADQLEDIKAIVEHERFYIPPENVTVRNDCCLGQGGFGSVFMGRFRGAHVAVKIPRVETHSKGLKQLSNELRILRHVHHPNLLQCYGAVIDVTCCRFGLVLEFVRGVSFRAFKFDMCDTVGSEQRFQVVAGITSALSYLHSRCPVIVHGDLKPENVIIAQLQSLVHPKLLDFGLSRLLTSGVSSLGGTLRWMAPEVAQRRNEKPKASADIFSFGYMLYFTATGNLPYAKLRREEVQKCHRLGVLAVLTWSLSSSFEVMSKEMVETCLQPSEQRPSIDNIMSCLIAWWERNKSGNVNERWLGFADRDLLRRATSSDRRLARDSPEHERFKDASEPRGLKISL